MRLLSWMFLIIAILVGVSFAILNSEFVTVHYYVGARSVPLSILIVGSLILGIVVGWLISLPSLLKLKMECMRLSRKSN